MNSHRAFLGLVTGSRLQAATDQQGYLATLPISKRTRPTAQFSADWWATMTQVRKRVRAVKPVFFRPEMNGLNWGCVMFHQNINLHTVSFEIECGCLRAGVVNNVGQNSVSFY